MTIRTLPTLCLTVFATFCGLQDVNAQEWTRFRGPGGTGISASKAISGGFTEKDYRWTVDLPGSGTSSPVLWGTRLFLTAEAGQDGQRQVLCFDASTGKPLWTHVDTFKPHGHHKFNNFASSTPTCDATHVYLAWTSGSEMQVLALTHDGKKVWDQNLGHYEEDHGSGASPVVAGDVLVVSKDHSGTDAFVAGLDVKSGKVKWKLPRKTSRSAFSTPMLIEDDARAGHWFAVINSNPNALTCIDTEDGKVVWEHNYPTPSQFRAVGSPALADGVFLASVGQGGGGQQAVALEVTKGKPSIAWEMPKGLPYVPTPLGKGEHFFVLNDGGIFSCIKAKTGDVVYKERLFDNSYSSPVCVGENILCISRTGQVVIVKASDKFEKIGEATLGEPCESTPAIANGMVFIRTAKRLIALGGKPNHKGAGLNLEVHPETQSIQPGKKFTAALRIQHDAGYHTYWQNPGIAGVPMTLKWTLPPGWTAGETQWAPPEKVFMATLLTHGYEKDTHLLYDLTPPTDLVPGSTVHLSAKLSWMCCAKTCHPGFADLVVSVPVSQEAPADSDWAAAIRHARSVLPPQADGWAFSAVREGEHILLTATAKASPANTPEGSADPIFFSENTLVCSHAPQKWRRTETGFVADLPIPDYAGKELKTLAGLLFAPDGWHGIGKDPYVRFSVNLASH